MKTVKILSVILGTALILSVFMGCSNESKGFDASAEIGAISREEGSGTRDAFEELFEIERTTDSAVITNSTAVMLTTVSDDLHAIGYVSLGSLNDSVKAIKIEGFAPSVETVKSGEYKISRPFNIVTKENLSDAASDFISFILSADGGRIAEENGYISVSRDEAYASKGLGGKVVVSGSSSVTPLMEKLAEGYEKLNPNTDIEIQQSDSSTGVTDAIDSTSDIGMASRELKDSEKGQGVESTVIAMDGIAVIVNPESEVEELALGDVKEIFEGKAVYWSDVLD